MLNSYELVHEAGMEIWAQLDFSPLVIGMKGLACSFLLIRWIGNYQKSLRDSNRPKFDYWDLIYGVLYMSVIVNCDALIYVLDDVMVQVGNWSVANLPMPENDLEMFQNSSWTEITGGLEAMDPEKSALTKISDGIIYVLSLDWVYDGIAQFCLMFSIVADYSAFMVREFALIGAKLLMPIALTLAVIPEFKERATKFLLVYMGIYLTGYLFILAICVANSVFTYGATILANWGADIGISGEAFALIPKVILLWACVKAKVEMFKESQTLVSKILA